ncbi:unnamed protein product [Fraxinus pennsylvanica]|uniref:Glucose-methanol-choline oxidoreductase C-terminal domain-containing protein n=1 Tax=Fraxinus pennsylvanica TaxID=56036 RepID=A0AAD2E4U1_9LAMI|nr:unnamed protein product [Fraxinus pennsylvanica]
MSDNSMNDVFSPSPLPVELSLIQVVGITQVGSFIEAASGFFELVWAHRIAQEVSKFKNQTDHYFRIPFNESTQEAMSRADPYRYANIQAGVILEKIAGPFSNGRLELQNRDPNDNPRSTFNYFKYPRDLQRCVQGSEIVRKVVKLRSLSTFRYPFAIMQTLMNMTLTSPVNLRPKHVRPTYSMEQFCVDTVMTISPGTNPQATVMMLGRYMGLRILQERNPH